jgi:hypothetical protein
MGDSNVEELLRLARKRFGVGDIKVLSPADEKLFTAVASGLPANYLVGDDEVDDPVDHPANDPANVDAWDESRIIPADRLEWLCFDRDAKNLVSDHGINVIGAGVRGTLRLGGINCPWGLRFAMCSFSAGVQLDGASIRELWMTGSHKGKGVRTEWH